MKTITTDTEGVTLTLGEHITSDPTADVSFGRNTAQNSAYAFVDSVNRRVIYFYSNPAGGSIMASKVKRALKLYEALYGTVEALAVVAVRDGIVTSGQFASQKRSYFWDWETNKQVVVKGGRKYDEVGSRR
jgi:hypothetical protein